MIRIKVDDLEVEVERGSSVAAAVFAIEPNAFRRSVAGEARFPLCGMGVCFECRVTINGIKHQRSCQILAEEGMIISTDE